MKFAYSLTLMLALGLSAVYSQQTLENEFFSPADEEVMNELLAMEDLESELEIVDFDDALHKGRVLKKMMELLAEAESMDASHPQKRFIGSVFQKLGNAIGKMAKTLGEFFSRTWNKAMSAFKKVASKDNFKAAVERVLPLLHSNMTLNACEKVLMKTTTVILKDIFPLAVPEARPLCEAALLELDKFVKSSD